jgi:tetratricopeptide (TPR) repeat protein
VAVMPTDAAAQSAAALDRVDAALAAGRLTEARETLDRWQRASAARADGEERARALLLQARLAGDTDAAFDAFLGVVLAHPSSAAAPEALLRLGQGLVAAGEHARAAAYLERRATDYPGAPRLAEGLLWLARAQRLAGQRASACTTASRARETDGQPHDLRALIELELESACTSSAAVTGSAVAGSATAGAAGDGSAASSAATGAYSVQAGAFREAAGAERVARALREAGFDARVAIIEGSPLHRVRIGRFANARDAAAVAGRLTAVGHAAIIVDDVIRERS